MEPAAAQELFGLQRRWATAKDVHLSTALELRLHDTTTYRMGRLLITTVQLHDVGLVGGTGKEPQGHASDYASDVETSAMATELAAMGLPTGFGRQQAATDRSKKAAAAGRHAHRNTDGPRASPLRHEGGRRRGDPHAGAGGQSPWLQCWDDENGLHYYYNTLTQASQWEAPEEGFSPFDAAGGTGRDTSGVQDNRDANGNGHAAAAAAALGAAASVAGTPPALARLLMQQPAQQRQQQTTAGTLAAAAQPQVRMLTEEDILKSMGLTPNGTAATGSASGAEAVAAAAAVGGSAGAAPPAAAVASGLLGRLQAAAATPSTARASAAAQPTPLHAAAAALAGGGVGGGRPPAAPSALLAVALSEEEVLQRMQRKAAAPPPPPAPQTPPPPSPLPPPPTAGDGKGANGAAAAAAAAPGQSTAAAPPVKMQMLTEADILRRMMAAPAAAGPALGRDGSGAAAGSRPAPGSGPSGPPPGGPGADGSGGSGGPAAPPPGYGMPQVGHPGAPWGPAGPGPHHTQSFGPQHGHVQGPPGFGGPPPPPGFNHMPSQSGGPYGPPPHHMGGGPVPPPGFGMPPLHMDGSGGGGGMRGLLPGFGAPLPPPPGFGPPGPAPPGYGYGTPETAPPPGYGLPQPPPGFAPQPPPGGMQPPPPGHGPWAHDSPFSFHAQQPPSPHGLPGPGPGSHPPGAPPFPCGPPLHPHAHHRHHHHHHHHPAHQSPYSNGALAGGGAANLRATQSEPPVPEAMVRPAPPGFGRPPGPPAPTPPQPMGHAMSVTLPTAGRGTTWTLQELERQLEVMAAELEQAATTHGSAAVKGEEGSAAGQGLLRALQAAGGGGGGGDGGGNRKGAAITHGSAPAMDSTAADDDEGAGDDAFYDAFAAGKPKRGAEQQQQHQEQQQHLDGRRDKGERERVGMDPNTAAYVRTILPRNAAKYWMQRYSLFSRFDADPEAPIQLDTEGWWSVTPEVLAAHQALRCKQLSAGRGSVMMDACCGCGGNVIQMALACAHVIGVDISPKRIEMARHNAAAYGVAHKCDFICADYFSVAEQLKVDVLFMSPPWGGPKYQHVNTFDLYYPLVGFNTSLVELLDVAMGTVAGTDGVVAAFLPRNTDLEQLSEVIPEGHIWELERGYVNNKLKGITLYCHPGKGGAPNVVPQQPYRREQQPPPAPPASEALAAVTAALAAL